MMSLYPGRAARQSHFSCIPRQRPQTADSTASTWTASSTRSRRRRPRPQIGDGNGRSDEETLGNEVGLSREVLVRSRRTPGLQNGDAPILYQSSFTPNWTWRDVVDVLVITPAVGETPEGVNTTALGRLKFARLRRLNISARN